MANRLRMRRTIWAKIESPYGTDAVPTAAEAMYAYDLAVTPMEQVLHERNPIRPFFGPDSSIPGGSPVKCEFGTPIAGAGGAGTAAPYGVLLRAAAHAQTLNVGVDATYSLISSTFESCSIYINVDGVLHKLTGVRAVSVAFEYNHGEVPMMKFSFIGIYNAPSDVALGSMTLTAFQTPLIMNRVNTTPMSLHAISVRLHKLAVQCGLETSWKDYVNNTEEVRITNRKVTGSIAMEADTLAVKDWFATARAGTLGALTLTHGTASGNKAKHDASNVQLFNPKYGNADGIETVESELGFFPSAAGNDEYTFKVL